MDHEAARIQTSLGRDFLTYLCYLSDSRAGTLHLDHKGDECSVWIDGKIVLANDSTTPPSILAYSGEDFSANDLKQAIRSGKRVREARLRIEKGSSAWTFTLRADRFDISGLKIDMPGAPDPEERLFGRIISIEALNDIIDRLYGMFIHALHDPSWKKRGYAAFQTWLHAREEG